MCVCVCVCVHLLVNIHVCVCVCTHTHIYIYIGGEIYPDIYPFYPSIRKEKKSDSCLLTETINTHTKFCARMISHVTFIQDMK